MLEIGQIAHDYFEAFHAGRHEVVLGYFADDGVVSYGTEPARPARQFFPETRDMIATLTFETHGIYRSPDTNNVVIHFSFTTPATEGADSKTTEAIDIIEFNRDRQIVRIKVIANG